MKKIINIFSLISIITTGCTVGCASNTLSVNELGEIFEIAKSNVLDNYNQVNGIPDLFQNDLLILPPSNSSEQNSDYAQTWHGKIKEPVHDLISARNDEALITNKKNLISGDEENQYNKYNEKIKTMKTQYHSLRIADVQYKNLENENEIIWLSSQHNEKQMEVLKIGEKEKEVKVPEKNMPKKETNVSEKGISKTISDVYKYISLNQLWTLDEHKPGTNYKVRFLFTFLPSEKYNTTPVIFYVDTEMMKGT